MRLALAEQMREIDERAQSEYQLSGELLMESAALATAGIIRDRLKIHVGQTIYIFCGKGNNGGDGLALARILVGQGYQVTAVLLYSELQYKGLAALNLQRARKFDVRMEPWQPALEPMLATAALIVDALLGTGSKGVPRSPLTEAIEVINRVQRPVLAVDLPSGIDVDSGGVPGAAVRADLTICFGLGKPGLYCYPGANYAGEVVVARIGFPPALLESETLQLQCLTGREAARLLPRRKADAHKGVSGHLLVVGGSSGMTGASVLTSLAALRSGCGLVSLAFRAGLHCPEKPVEVMTVTWDEALGRLEQYRGVVFGPGLGLQPDGRIMLEQLIDAEGLPLVIDADGLNLLAGDLELLRRVTKPVILTPHPGEMARLTGLQVTEIQQDRVRVARHYAASWEVIVILKGARTVIAFPDGQAFINLTGNSAMATAGMGDVLAGMIGSLMVQGITGETASVLGPYIHGLAGDLVVKQRGSVGLIASDLLAALPDAYKRVFDDEI